MMNKKGQLFRTILHKNVLIVKSNKQLYLNQFFHIN